MIALLICNNCDVSPERSYATQWQYLKSYHYLLIALWCIYYSEHWMLLALQLSGISMKCKILLWLCPCVCHSVCVLSAHIVSSSHKPHTQANKCTTGVVHLLLITGYVFILSGCWPSRLTRQHFYHILDVTLVVALLEKFLRTHNSVSVQVQFLFSLFGLFDWTVPMFTGTVEGASHSLLQ